jgi:hypothetical protein
MKCSLCGSVNLVEGALVGGDEQATRFVFAERSLWKKVLGVGGRKVAAFACMHCGGVHQVVKFTDGDREQFAEFEGPQPSVVDEVKAPGETQP